MADLPTLDTVATACLLIGLLFLLRYFLAMRRLWRDSGHPRSFAFEDYFRATKPGAFGREHEPERRHAARQFHAGMIFLGIGLVLFAWLVSLGVPVSFGL